MGRVNAACAYCYIGASKTAIDSRLTTNAQPITMIKSISSIACITIHCRASKTSLEFYATQDTASCSQTITNHAACTVRNVITIVAIIKIATAAETTSAVKTIAKTAAAASGNIALIAKSIKCGVTSCTVMR